MAKTIPFRLRSMTSGQRKKKRQRQKLTLTWIRDAFSDKGERGGEEEPFFFFFFFFLCVYGRRKKKAVADLIVDVSQGLTWACVCV